MNGLIRSLLLMATLAAAVAVEPAGAATTIYSEVVTTAHWKAFEVTTPGGTFELRWLLPRAKDVVQIGSWFYNADRTFRGGFAYSSFEYQDRTYADVRVAPGMPITVDETGPVYDFELPVKTTNVLPGTPEEPKTYTMVLWWQGDIAGGIPFEISAPAGFTLGRVSTGTNLMIAMSKDFDAAAKADVQRSVPRVPGTFPNGLGPGARAIAAGRRSFVATGDAVVGVVGPLGPPPIGYQANKIDVSTPGGGTTDCSNTCRFYDATGAAALGSGAYVLSLTGAGAGVGPFGDVLFYLIDVTFPS